jgi:hypothetical protein
MPVLARRAFRESQFPILRKGFPDMGEHAFAFAKACGIIGKSFVGKRISALGKLHSLGELDRLVFPEVLRELPGRELLIDLESRIVRRSLRQILAVIDSYSKPPELLVHQLRSCEYADLKTCLHYIAAGKTVPPALSDIGHFGTIHFQAYPDIAAMLAGTEFTFIPAKDLKALKSADYDFAPLETKLDLHYYTLLVQCLSRLSAVDRHFAGRIIAEEISLRNCVWALRLRTYFQKKPEEAAKYLMELNLPRKFFAGNFDAIPGDIPFRASGREISLAAEAFALLHFPLDSRSAWKGWRWESLLNPEKTEKVWNVDPRYFQNAASRYIYRLSLRCFRSMPF